MIKSVHKKLFKGFTLIELLIVIAILGILAAAVLVAIDPAKRTNQARDAQRKNDIGSIATEVQAYYTTPGEGIYPTAGGSDCGTGAGAWTILTSAGGLKQLPDDPKSAQGWEYCYNVNTGGTEASVYATLDDPAAAGNVWCWRSESNRADEQAAANCTAP